MSKANGLIIRIKNWITQFVKYVTVGVWSDSRSVWNVSLIKVANLSVRLFFDAGLHTKACALTYRTALAIVPALALLLAIGRGFGLQDLLKEQLLQHVPNIQQQALDAMLGFVESYLDKSSGGIFIGVGIVFLLWTLISLLRNIEVTFNEIWQAPKNRSLLRSLADYLAILIIIPILIICTSGISIFMSTSLGQIIPFEIAKPAVEFLIEIVGFIFSWMLFAVTYVLIPNTKVRFKNAIIPGIIIGTTWQILQWLFLNGQLYVANYNAIYGSFSLIPLLLIWIQLIWLFTLIGSVLCFAIQNIDNYNYGNDIEKISINYRHQIAIAIMSIVAKRFKLSMPPLTPIEISRHHHLPINLVVPELLRLRELGFISFIDAPDKELSDRPVQPAVNVYDLTVSSMVGHMMTYGTSDFIPGFNNEYDQIREENIKIYEQLFSCNDSKRLIDIDIKLYSKH